MANVILSSVTNGSLGGIEVERISMHVPVELEILRVNTTNIRRFTMTDPFGVDVMHVDGQYIHCGPTYCWSLVRDDNTGLWTVLPLKNIVNNRMKMSVRGRQVRS
jgi:hypothetical protein